MANFETINAYPLWLRSTMKLLGVVLAYMILSYGRFILMPLALSALLALLLESLCNMLEKLKIGRVPAIILSMITAFLILAGIIYLLSIQLVQFSSQLPEAGARLKQVSGELQAFFQNKFNVSPAQTIDFFQQNVQKLINQSGQFITTVLGTTTSIFSVLGLLPFFVFFMLYYKEMYVNFAHQIWPGKEEASVESVLEGIQSITKNYIVGMITVIALLATLNTFGLWIIGMDHVLFFALFASVFAIIPYIGIVIGSIPAFLYALLFFNSLWMPLGVLCVFFGVQFLEGNFITPNIVGSRVSINPFMALVALVIGGEVWGIVGMIIFVPFVGILKCICDEVEGLRPYGYLLGNVVDYNQSQQENRSTNT